MGTWSISVTLTKHDVSDEEKDRLLEMFKNLALEGDMQVNRSGALNMGLPAEKKRLLPVQGKNRKRVCFHPDGRRRDD